MSADAIHLLLHQFGYAFVFLLLLIEAIGLPVPGETAMVGAALYAASTHHLALVPLLAAAFTGTALGGMIGYALGRRYGAPLLLRYGRRIGLHADRRLLGRYLMQRNGAALVFLGRFVALLRSVTALLAGANRMGWRRFAVFNALGSAAWTGLYCIGAYTVGHAIMNVAGGVGVIIGVVAVAALVAGWVFIRRNEARLTERARHAAIAGELE